MIYAPAGVLPGILFPLVKKDPHHRRGSIFVAGLNRYSVLFLVDFRAISTCYCMTAILTIALPLTMPF
jgi:hypothetical protein